MHILFLPHSYSSPAARFRIWQFIPYLEAMGYDVDVAVIEPAREWSSKQQNGILRRIEHALTVGRQILSIRDALLHAEQYDVIMMNRDIVPEPRLTFLEPYLARRNPRLIFDFDDAIHLGQREAKLRQILPVFKHITPGNEYLAEFARQTNDNVTILPTVVDTSKFIPADEREPGVPRIGWSGSSSSARLNLPVLRPILEELAQDTSLEFEFVVVSNEDPRIDWRGVKTRFVQWSPETEVLGIQLMDIGFMPLDDGPLERGKCGLKAIQYMACGVTPVVSPVGVNEEIVVHEEHGYHARTHADWIQWIKHLIANPDLNRQMGRAARQRAVDHYSIDYLLPRLTDLFERIQ
jgi:glycosyltransferase involved in cell wall biosynthesis